MIFHLSRFAGFVGQGVGFADREYLVWYILFVIFVPYAMLPLPLKWCVVGGTITASCHLAVITIIKLQHGEVIGQPLELKLFCDFCLSSPFFPAGHHKSRVRALPDLCQLHSVYGHQRGRNVHKVSHGSRTTTGIHRNAQGHGAQKRVGKGAPAHSKTTGFK